MNTKQMTDKIQKIETGSLIVRNGKTYEVKHIISRSTGKLCVTRIEVLEVGLPETYERPGLFLNAGKVLTFSNLRVWDLRAQRPSMDWEFA